MPIRLLTRLRIALSVITLLMVVAQSTVPIAGAVTRYEYTDGAEGDPGDGVLDPAIDRSQGGNSGGATELISSTNETVPTISWFIPVGDFTLVPVYVPGTLPGQGTLIYIVRAWARHASAVPFLAGGWHNAP